jgi:hypothetical protein
MRFQSGTVCAQRHGTKLWSFQASHDTFVEEDEAHSLLEGGGSIFPEMRRGEVAAAGLDSYCRHACGTQAGQCNQRLGQSFCFP